MFHTALFRHDKKKPATIHLYYVFLVEVENLIHLARLLAVCGQALEKLHRKLPDGRVERPLVVEWLERMPQKITGSMVQI